MIRSFPVSFPVAWGGISTPHLDLPEEQRHAGFMMGLQADEACIAARQQCAGAELGDRRFPHSPPKDWGVGWMDATECLSVHRRENGEYLILQEEDERSKNLLHLKDFSQRFFLAKGRKIASSSGVQGNTPSGRPIITSARASHFPVSHQSHRDFAALAPPFGVDSLPVQRAPEETPTKHHLTLSSGGLRGVSRPSPWAGEAQRRPLVRTNREKQFPSNVVKRIAEAATIRPTSPA